MRHTSTRTRLPQELQPPLKFEVTFCVRGVLSPLPANIYLDALDQELDRRGHAYCRYADDGNIYGSSQAAAERTLASIRNWIEKHLRLQVNAAKSGTGRPWERKFLGFRLNRLRRITIAPESLERFKSKVRQMWRSCPCLTSEQLVERWQQFIRGWWAYYQITDDRIPIFHLPTGGLDPQTYPEVLLATLAQTGGPEAQAAVPGVERRPAESSAQQQRSLASCRHRQS